MSFTPEPEVLRSLDDLGTLRALANPVRRRILNHLMSFGPQTASQCSTVVGATPSNCSYHLRELARFGLVERAPDELDDARERSWRSVATGLRTTMNREPADPALRGAELALAQADLQLANELTDRALAHWDDQPPEWLAAATLSTYALRLTPEELLSLIEKLDQLIRPFLALTRKPAGGASVTHLRLDAFRHPDAETL